LTEGKHKLNEEKQKRLLSSVGKVKCSFCSLASNIFTTGLEKIYKLSVEIKPHRKETEQSNSTLRHCEKEKPFMINHILINYI
jgi:hypothetical protein